MVKLFYTVLIVLLPSAIYAQMQERHVIDSLLHALPGAKDDSNKVKLLSELSARYHTVDPAEGIKYGGQALELAHALNWKPGIADANSSIGLNYEYKSDYPQAIDYDFRSLKLYEELGDKMGEANIMRNIASVYQYEKDYPKTLEYNLKSLHIYESMNNKRGIAGNLSNIGIFYFFQQDYTRALEYDFKALKYNEEVGVKSNIAINLGNIGDAYLHKKDYGRSLAYSFRSLRLFEELGDTYGRAIALGNIGEAYFAVAKDSSSNVPADSLIPRGRAANLRNAIDYLNRSIAASKEISQLENIIEFSAYLSDAYALSGDYKNALASYKQYTEVNDSVYSAGNSMKIKQSDHQHELELKDRDIQIAKLAVAKKHNERIFFIAGICLLMIITGIVFRNFKLQKQANSKLMEAKKRSDDLLQNILPEEVADELKTTGIAAVKHFEHVTILFTDFVNFTEAGERMTPEQLIAELHICFKTFDRIIDKYKIEKIKTIGDAYLAVSGLPVAVPDHATQIVKAAIEINTFMLNRRQQLGDMTFELRSGVHSGSVVAGIVGVKKFAYDIWGDAVNTAARLQQCSEAGKINISETTYELIKGQIACTCRGEVFAKHKGEMRMYFVNG